MTDTAETSTWLDPHSAQALLSSYNIPTPSQKMVSQPDPVAAARAAEDLGWPVVLKAVAPSLVHKSDAGGVRLGLASRDAVEAAAREMIANVPDLSGFLLQQQAPAGQELIVGCRRDPSFGPLVLVGLGGVWVEALQDVSLRLAPIDHDDAYAMLSELRGTVLLDGFRGQPAVDRDALADLLVRVSRLVNERPEIVEMDLNPVIAGSGGVLAVDARVLVSETGTPDGQSDQRRSSLAVQRLLAPRSIAIIGASAERTKPGGRLFHYLLKHGYAGQIYPVNPRAESIMGYTSYPSVAELPETPDLACILTPSATVPDVVAQCGVKGIPSAIVFASGFGETGEEGRRAQQAIVDAARASGLRLCGPNTVGVVNATEAVSMCAAFGMALEIEQIPRGDIAFITQSGALGGSLLSRSWAEGVGFSHWVCAGNEADLSLSDYLDYLVDEPSARVIALFMEMLHDPPAFIDAARRARELGKSVVVYKTGASEVGRRAVQSHTGALAGDDRVYDAAFRAASVARVPDLQALVDASVALAWQPLPKGRRVGVISGSGGACSVIADECARHGLELPMLRDETVDRVRQIIPPFGASQNPIDVTIEINRNPGMVGELLELLLNGDEVDAVVVLMTTNADPPALEVAKGVVEASRGATKPVLIARVGAEFLAPASIDYYREAHIPLVPMPDRVVKALRAMVDVAGV